MNIRDLACEFADKFRQPIKKAIVHRAYKPVTFYGMAGSSASVAFSMIGRLSQHPFLIIANDLDDAGYIYNDIAKLIGEESVLMFPSAYKRALKYGQIDSPSQILRTEVLRRFHTSAELRCVVSYPEALAETVSTPEDVDDKTLRLDIETPIDQRDVVKWLLDNGFFKVDYVYEPGQFSVRGSIIDIFGYSNEMPYRVDFFGDDIDSIRVFDIETQLSRQKHEHASITSNLDSTTEARVSLLEFIGEDTVVFTRSRSATIAGVKKVATDGFSASSLHAEEGDTTAVNQIVDVSRFEQAFLSHHPIRFTAATEISEQGEFDINFNTSPQRIYHKNFELISADFKRLIADDYRLFILSDSEKQVERLKIIFKDRGEDIDFTPVYATIHEGFVDHESKLCLFTDHQIFDRYHRYNLRSDRVRTGKLALSLKELNSIEIGDYVVHADHGIGRFAGLVQREINGNQQELIKITYQNDDVIYVAIHALHKISKYKGKEGIPPRVNRLGSGAWNRIKERTKSKLKDIARDLIKLYAARLKEDGFAFSADTYLQHELEASFMWEDTPDQITITAAVKADMEKSRPMDRLVCGDVGFGKTEIAIRAAFKAATDNKQTAVLVPTTVLAFQHYNTFSERLKDFPVRVEYLSRARSPKETKQILTDLADGKIDIIIGTHKLIGKNVKFKDLGLLVVDEEQRFGVSVKDKLKQMKVNVDTLTMSATPIPRTLQFSLMGARDLSTMNTPPPNRYPILTTLATLSDELISEAINFELSRNGQVFIVNPRIEGLANLEDKVKRIIPDARTIIAHGQMSPDTLEKTIYSFINHDYDVLLSTTIIESGLDMPNVNTIIINDAHRFGLSALHQLRGRVGRSSRKAFCYLLAPPDAAMTPQARMRLQAIENFSELGSGFQIAMQDLDIRGAGNLLGAEQSGFIADLGYETYQRVLKEAVLELRTEEFPTLVAENDAIDNQDYTADCTIESDMRILIPPTYVAQDTERISLYKQLDSIEREEDLEVFERQLVDRFGKIPDETGELLLIPRVRNLARRLGFVKLLLKEGKMFIYFVGKENRAYYESPMFGRLMHYVGLNQGRCRFRQIGEKNSIVIFNVTSVATALDILREVVSLEAI